MKYRCLLIALVIFLLSTGSGSCNTEKSSSLAPQQQTVQFKWAFVAARKAGDNEELVSITRDTSLSSGDRFKLMIDVQSDCFVYLLFRTSGGEILKFLPQKTKEPRGPDSAKTSKVYLPGADTWFVLDENPGVEKLLLLASAVRLTSLEELLESYAKADGKERERLVSDILGTIKELRRSNTRFKAKVERPLQIGGMFRGVTTAADSSLNLDNYATQVSAEKFFAKTFTIEHR